MTHRKPESMSLSGLLVDFLSHERIVKTLRYLEQRALLRDATEGVSVMQILPLYSFISHLLQ